MSEFKTCLEVRLLPESPGVEEWFVLTPLIYQSDLLELTVVIPVGFVTNFVSFKSLNWLAHRPSCLHDFLVSCSDLDISLANLAFKESLESVDVGEELAGNMYAAVDLFGNSHKENTYLLSEHSRKE
jgi:hypothetical protein